MIRERSFASSALLGLAVLSGCREAASIAMDGGASGQVIDAWRIADSASPSDGGLGPDGASGLDDASGIDSGLGSSRVVEPALSPNPDILAIIEALEPGEGVRL